MNEFFSVVENKIKFYDVIKTWLFVPYFHMGRTRGGIDCLGVVGEILKESSILQDYYDSEYPKDWFIHGDEQLVLNSIERNFEYLKPGILCRQDEGTKMFGDLLCFWTRRRGICNHVAFFLSSGNMIHCTEGSGVHISQPERWENRLMKKYRLYFESE